MHTFLRASCIKVNFFDKKSHLCQGKPFPGYLTPLHYAPYPVYSTKPGLLHPVSSVWVWARIPLDLPRMLRYIFPPGSQRLVFFKMFSFGRREKCLHVSLTLPSRSHPKDFEHINIHRLGSFFQYFWTGRKESCYIMIIIVEYLGLREV